MLVVGGIGMGLVWGWLLVLVWRDAPAKLPFRSAAFLLFATILMGTQQFLFNGGEQVVVFGVTAVIAFSIHLAWRIRLQNQTDPS